MEHHSKLRNRRYRIAEKERKRKEFLQAILISLGLLFAGGAIIFGIINIFLAFFVVR